MAMAMKVTTGYKPMGLYINHRWGELLVLIIGINWALFVEYNLEKLKKWCPIV